MQIIIWKQSANDANYYPACNYKCSILWSWAFAEGDVKNYWSVTGCHLKSPTLYSWEQQSNSGAKRASIEDNQIKRRPCSSAHLEAEEFLQNQGGADQVIWAACRCPHGPRTFSSSWISFNTSRPMPQTDSSSSLPPTHVGRHAPKLEPSALVSSDFRWWVLGQPLPHWSSRLRIPSVYWMQQSTSLSTAQWKTRACPLQL